MAKPNFFIVGAPKCGTTALYEYLKDHPEIFMSAIKEPHHFSTDFDMPMFARYRDREAYLDLFRASNGERRLGEASAWYLHSRVAAQNIFDFEPEARIIIMLRNPVDMLYSLHGQLFYSEVENLASFEDALAVEDERRAGRCLPDRNPFMVEALFYREVGKFTDAVQRYFDVFGEDAVKVIFFDEFRQDTARVYRETLEHLGVDSSFETSFEVVNPNKVVRNRRVQRLVTSIIESDWFLVHLLPPIQRMVPAQTRSRIKNFLTSLHSDTAKRPPMPPKAREQLHQALQSDIDRLGGLLGRDLSHWHHA